MTREEVVRLVSRALACIEAIAALSSATSLPEQLLWVRHHLQLATVGTTSAADLVTIDRVEVAFCFGRIAMFLCLALIFWNCGLRVARFLMPEPKTPPSPIEPAGN